MSEELPELPEGWELVSISEITLPYETIQPTREPERKFQYIDIGSINNATQTVTSPKTFLGKDAPSRARRVVKKDDVLFSTVRTYLKNIARVPAELDGVLTSTGIAVLRAVPGVDSNFLFYFVSSEPFIREISGVMDGTLYPAVTDSDVATARMPLPPLNEQRRIVAKIEALMARSQRAKEALEAIPPLLDQFRQSVLAAAFRGDLTAEWREQNSATEWEGTTLGEIIKHKPRNGYSPKPVDYPTKVKSLTLSATTSGRFKPEYFKYIDEETDSKSHLWLYPGDILISEVILWIMLALVQFMMELLENSSTLT